MEALNKVKKQKKHVLFLCLLLFLGVFLIGTTGGAYAKLIGLPTDNETENSVKTEDTAGKGKTNNKNYISLFPVGKNGADKAISHTSENQGENNTNSSVSSDDPEETSIQAYMPISTKQGSSTENRNPQTGTHSGRPQTAASPNGTSKSLESSSYPPSGTGSTSSSGSTSSTSSGSGSSSTSSGSTSTISSSSGSSSSHHHSHHSHHTVAITSVSLDKSTLYFPTVGGTATLKATVAPVNTTQGKSITWSSADESIAVVDKTGKVTAVKGGRTKITAKTVNGKTAVCSVTVRIPATKVTLDLNNQPEIEIEKGSSLSLSASLEPADTTDGIKWTTSDSKIITVDSSGKITAVNAGTATIKATSGGVSAECKVTVGISITKIKLSNTDITLKKGDSKTITAAIVPLDTTEDKTLTWSSSDDKVAEVDSSGNITAAGGGKAVITVQAGKHISQCNVTVTVPLTGIKFEQSTFKLTKGKPEKLPLVLTPSDATDKALTWGSSDPSIATVDSTSGTVTGVSVGTTTITAIAHDGGFVTQCTVNVVVPVTGISFEKTSIALIKGKTDTLAATITPADATDKALMWESSNTNVAMVDGNGKVTATGGGSAVITVTTHDGDFTATCDVTVTVPVTGIKLDKTRISLMPNGTAKLTATINPDDATDKAVTWTSSNPELVTVDQKGNVKILGKTGSSTVTVTTHDGGHTASCTVLAMIHVKGIALDKTSMTIYKWNSSPLKVSFNPSDATDKAVTWSSSDTSVATVSSSGNVYGQGYGTATITATSHDGGYKTSCTVTVHGEIQAKVLRSYHSSVNEDGSFDLYDDAGTGHHTLNSRHAYNSLILTFNHPISYTKGSSIAFFREINGWIDRDDESPYIAVYAGDKLVATSDCMRSPKNNVNCVAKESGSFSKLTIEVTGYFYVGNEDPTESPSPGGFHLKFPAGSLEVCGRTINSVEVIKQ